MIDFELLYIEDILSIHEEAIKSFGGSFELYRDSVSKIRSILDQQYPHFDHDKYPSVFEKAAMLWYFLTKKSLLCGW